MKRIASILIALSMLAACAAPASRDSYAEPAPGRISKQRHLRDQETCYRIDQLVKRDSGFLFEIARDCHIALSQILDANTALASFDVARAYLDALHDYANTADFVQAQGEDSKISSDIGAYLIGQQTGLIGAMHDWRYEHGLQKHPMLYKASRQTMA